MMIEGKASAALRALQGLLIRARTMAHEGARHDQLADILDGAEYLTALLYDEKDQTIAFRSYLEQVCRAHACQYALQRFDEEP